MGITAAWIPGCSRFFRRNVLMQATFLPFIGLLLSIAGGIFANVFQTPPIKLIGSIILYFGGSILLLNVSSPQTCAALLICGIGVTVLLGTGNLNLRDIETDQTGLKENYLFRILIAAIFGILAYTLTGRLRLWIPVRRSVLFTSLWVGMISLISLALDDILLFRCIYLQNICLAFTMSYIYIENSVLVFACFSAINLLMAFGSAVLISSQTSETPERTDAS